MSYSINIIKPGSLEITENWRRILMTKQLASDSSHAWFMLMTLHESAWWLTKSHLWVIRCDAPCLSLVWSSPTWRTSMKSPDRRTHTSLRRLWIWYWSGTGLVLVWYWPGTGLVLVWYWSGTGLVLVWYGSGTGLVLVWYLKVYPDRYLPVDKLDAVIEYRFLKC